MYGIFYEMLAAFVHIVFFRGVILPQKRELVRVDWGSGRLEKRKTKKETKIHLHLQFFSRDNGLTRYYCYYYYYYYNRRLFNMNSKKKTSKSLAV